MRSQFDGLKFSITVKVWRNMNGLTLRDMCELVGMSASQLNFVENGERTPTMAEFSHLCELMQFEAHVFFKVPEKPQNGRN